MCLLCVCFVFFNEPATTDIYTYCHTLSLHDALPIYVQHALTRLQVELGGDVGLLVGLRLIEAVGRIGEISAAILPVGVEEEIVEPVRQIVMMGNVLLRRSEEHTSELQSLMRISYAVFCLKQQKHKQQHTTTYN